jgi:hypothetical protein
VVNLIDKTVANETPRKALLKEDSIKVLGRYVLITKIMEYLLKNVYFQLVTTRVGPDSHENNAGYISGL